MRHSEAEIHFVNSGEELIEAWNEVGYYPAGDKNVLQDYAEVVGKGNHDFLVAKIGSIAVGTIFVKRNGPVNAEKEVFETALTEAHPGQQPISILYSIFVNPEYRGRNIARDLVSGAEQSIADRSDAVPRSALSVECDNLKAVNLLVRHGYNLIMFRGSYGVMLDRPDAEKQYPSKKPVYLMSKDLSGLRREGLRPPAGQ